MTVIRTTVAFHLRLDFYLQINFQMMKINIKKAIMKTGNKQAINDFIMYWEFEKKLILKSFKKQSNDNITSDVWPMNCAGVKTVLINWG